MDRSFPANALTTDPPVCARPAWVGVTRAAEAVRLPLKVVLHAGPPFRDATRPSPPVLSSTVLACRHEGWADTDAEAEALVASGDVILAPAQHFGVVTPLAEVVTSSTPLTRIADLAEPPGAAWAPLPSGNGPQLRFGTRNEAVLDRLAWRDRVLAPTLEAALRDPIDLIEPARVALAAGEDLHWTTTAATASLAQKLESRLPRDGAGQEIRAMLAASPLFFLTLWMAACRTMLLALAEGTPSVLLGLAGNGEDVGLLPGDDPMAWTVVPGAAPEGTRLDPAGTAPVSPMIGDSGVIDLAGFGGQREPEARASRWLELPHVRLGASVGLDLRTVVHNNALPRVHIGMIGADGRAGLLGRGTYRPPLSLFRTAMTDAIARTTPM